MKASGKWYQISSRFAPKLGRPGKNGILQKGVSHYEEVEGVKPGIFLNIFLAFITTTNQTISTPLLFNWNKEAVDMFRGETGSRPLPSAGRPGMGRLVPGCTNWDSTRS
jgi:hypothetical protein